MAITDNRGYVGVLGHAGDSAVGPGLLSYSVSSCTRCNGVLQSVEKGEVKERLPPLTRKYYEVFWMCGDCGQIYWKGAHYQKMTALMKGLLL